MWPKLSHICDIAGYVTFPEPYNYDISGHVISKAGPMASKKYFWKMFDLFFVTYVYGSTILISILTYLSFKISLICIAASICQFQ